MSCSPLLTGISEPEAVLGVLRDHPVLGYSEPSQTWRELEERGWVEYEDGRWRITEEGRKILGSPAGKGATKNRGPQLSLMDFFNE